MSVVVVQGIVYFSERQVGIVTGNPRVSGELPVPIPVKTRTHRTGTGIGTGLPTGFSLKSFNILKNKVFNIVIHYMVRREMVWLEEKHPPSILRFKQGRE